MTPHGRAYRLKQYPRRRGIKTRNGNGARIKNSTPTVATCRVFFLFPRKKSQKHGNGEIMEPTFGVARVKVPAALALRRARRYYTGVWADRNTFRVPDPLITQSSKR
ncbi:hypothetical protein GWI33_016442 [Rhynchophorus ferrugineus]|uniref:Uncharacterized protein n=1 Tax=Rhynchophorus ferrugineus TaxID=354439 RepID=A0A834M745_RHYFE|nr:hypothetical protein GWI33_016442 [Rhynchophorus ferrugineus]